MLRKLRGASVTEDLGEFSIRAIKVTRESIRNIVLAPGEPLEVFLDACFEEKVRTLAWTGSGSLPVNSWKLVLRSHPANVVLSVIKRGQSC